ncbi:MAG: hypothetical protein ACM3L6_02900 [Deltaproteobacteria bacterium]
MFIKRIGIVVAGAGIMLAALVVAGVRGTSFAESNENIDRCKAEFDIARASMTDPRWSGKTYLLTEYAVCMAVHNDTPSACSSLPGDKAVLCQKYYDEYHNFFGRLWKNRQPSPQLQDACLRTMSTLSGEDCNLFMKAWLKDDVSFCDQYRSKTKGECLAMMTGEDSYCNDVSCRNKAHYLKAIKSGDINLCNKIEDKYIKAMCQGYLARNEDVCRANRGFEEFKNSYCEAKGGGNV